MASNKNIREVYERSTYRYNWIYPVGNEQVEIQRNDDLDLDIDRVVSYIKEVLEEPLYDRENTALVLNIGLHCVMSVNFSSYQILLEKVLDLLFVNQTLTSKGKLQPRYKTTVIWKTTTQIRKENGDSLNLTDVRFYTTQRVLLYNAYATWRMCRAGIPVLDVLPVTLSYPSGPIDVEHYPDHVFKQAEDALADFKRFHNNKSNRLTRTCIYT
ncbi:uncharacterized protein LOC110252311 [Exaiptasia diaphana]|uniref:Uncharacterized protein n=1 Tax=Exaiptasia diaphana TaxID=2652724 RepID=A0A913Y662_EXADI|nr:uncharacterized protein LOC110252311 [Exaiptasia diaphana]KXJ28958.1 hypothetical protein AC249_AIPGENE1199 [Exaiptasia diaphana]